MRDKLANSEQEVYIDPTERELTRRSSSLSNLLFPSGRKGKLHPAHSASDLLDIQADKASVYTNIRQANEMTGWAISDTEPEGEGDSFGEGGDTQHKLELARKAIQQLRNLVVCLCYSALAIIGH